ncbi:MAG: hypothetical protein QN159_01635 [Armatimonadota bacterium]|nr:hypothetical protein [Armatimonadota bacterium]
MTTWGWWIIGFIAGGLGLILLSYLIRTIDLWPFSWLRRVLEAPIGLPRLDPDVPAELYYHPYPRRLQLNWLALVLGPVWYLLVGLWVHASIMATLVGLSGGLLAPIVWLYCGFKANEDLLEFRVASRSVY